MNDQIKNLAFAFGINPLDLEDQFIRELLEIGYDAGVNRCTDLLNGNFESPDKELFLKQMIEE